MWRCRNRTAAHDIVGAERIECLSHLRLQTETGHDPCYPIGPGSLLPAEVQRRFNQNWIIDIIGDDKLASSGPITRCAVDPCLDGRHVEYAILDDQRHPHIDRGGYQITLYPVEVFGMDKCESRSPSRSQFLKDGR